MPVRKFRIIQGQDFYVEHQDIFGTWERVQFATFGSFADAKEWVDRALNPPIEKVVWTQGEK